MVSSSKILTVSYGTFSCTAEGFDDPLEVVKETTHFFRGVVGEDRFFGAEPPQFDPDLASDYLRERGRDGKGTLSITSPPRVMAAAASAGAMAAAMNAPASTDDADIVDDLLPDDDTIEATAVLTDTLAPEVADLEIEVALDDVVPAGTEAAPAPQASAPDDIAAKLDRIRAVVAEAPKPEMDAPEEEIETPEPEPEMEAPEAEVETPLAETEAPEVTADEAVQTDPLELDLAQDTTDVSLESLLDEIATDNTDTDLTDDLAPQVDADIDESDHSLDDAVASLLAAENDEDDRDVPTGALALAAGAVTAGIAALTAEQAKADDVTPEQDTAKNDTPDQDTTVEAVEAALDRAWTEDTVPPAAPEIEEQAEAPAATPPLRARVVKVKRSDFEQALENGDLEEVSEEPTVPLADTSSLSPEEEEELARELAAVKAELASDFGAWDDEDDADDTLTATVTATDGPLRLDNPIGQSDDSWEADEAIQDSARKAVKLASPARALLTEHEVEDDDTSRLLDQTNSEMDEPEGNRRRSAIAHLRAAVAATKADRLLGKKADVADEQEPYREDLASVVRPRRPQSTTHSAERPAAPAAAATPLKLVAEQRIADTPSSAPAPVRPRRVRRTEQLAPQPTPQNDSGFAAYAADAGVKGLPELLEAAAAYMSYVEGRDQFSRPQLMTILRQAEDTDSSREDRLRSFGLLLREGKIRKTSGGRFTAAESISYKPAANG